MRAGILAARGDVVVVFDVDYFDPAFVDVVLPRLTAARRPRDRRRIEACARYPRHASVAASGDHRRLLHRAPDRVRTRGVRHARHEGHAPRASSSRSSRRCRNGTDLFDTELVLRADRAGLRGGRGAGDGRGAPPGAHADRPPHRPHDVRARAAADPALARAVGSIVTAPRFAAALSEHPVASHAVGEVAGEVLERFGGDEPDLLVLFVSPHFVGAMDDLTFALANLLEPGVMLGASVGRRRRRRPRGRGLPRRGGVRGLVSRRRAHAGRRSTSSARPTAPRSPAGPTSTPTRRPCSCSPIRSASRSTASSPVCATTVPTSR